MNAKNKSAQLLIVLIVPLLLPMSTYAWSPNTRELGTAVSRGDFARYFGNVSKWLNQKVPADAGKISEAALKRLLKDRAFVLALDQRQLIARVSVNKMGAFARAGKANRAFLARLLKNAAVMDLYLEGDAPLDNEYIGSLGVLRTILDADPDSHKGTYLKLAVATALAHAKPSTCFGSGKVIDPLKRFGHFKAAHKNKELDPIFDNLSVWEYRKVVDSWASDEDLTWAREMLRTIRPELVIERRYVRMTSEVKVGAPNWGPPPHRFAVMLAGGGKCGPRAWFGRMINQAFGVPVWGVKQPGHAAVGFLGNIGWKVKYGRGWDKSTWGGMNGNQFLEIANAREFRVDFSQAEHLRWLADALTAKAAADAVRRVAEHIQSNPKGPRTENRLEGKRPFKGTPDKPYKRAAGVQHLVAADYVKCHNAWRNPSYIGGQQVYFQKNKEGWVEYKVNVPRAGKYAIRTYHASVAEGCCFRIYVGRKSIGQQKLHNTTGLWHLDREWEFNLPKTNTIRFVFPYQRGVAVKWFELRRK